MYTIAEGKRDFVSAMPPMWSAWWWVRSMWVIFVEEGRVERWVFKCEGQEGKPWAVSMRMRACEEGRERR